MTSLEQQIAFGVLLNQGDDRPPLDSDDIFYWLNRGQDQIVRDRFRKLEATQELTDDIRTLKVTNSQIVTTYLEGAAFLNYKAELAAFPAGYLFFIAARAGIKFNKDGITTAAALEAGSRVVTGNYTERTVLCRISQQDDIYRLLMDSFNRTTRQSPLAYEAATGLVVYSDSTFVPTKVFLDYLKSPARISRSVSCELPTFIHPDVVEVAVRLFRQEGGRIPVTNQSPEGR